MPVEGKENTVALAHHLLCRCELKNQTNLTTRPFLEIPGYKMLLSCLKMKRKKKKEEQGGQKKILLKENRALQHYFLNKLKYIRTTIKYYLLTVINL